MEPRIQSLLLDDNFTIDNQLPFPLGPFAQHHQSQHTHNHSSHQHGSRPSPVEPSAPRPASFSLHDIYNPNAKDSHHHATFAGRQLSASSRPPPSPPSTSLTHEQHTQHNHPGASSSQPAARPPKSVPLAEVLNGHEQTSSGFSGSVNELLDNSGSAPGNNSPKKRRKVDGSGMGDQNIFTLPKPTLPVKKGARRPRIPPLLQGLHQPPPNAGLFPPITGERVAREGCPPPPPPPPATTKNAMTQQQKQKSTSTPAPRVEPRAPEKVTPIESKRLSPVQDGGKAPPKSTASDAAAASSAKPSAKTQKAEPSKRRKKWTEEETTTLLKGVAKFGIGNWKKILDCPEFSFDGRTAVDLKDRFRTCCPDEYRKMKKPKAGGTELDATAGASEASTAETASGKQVSSLVTSNILLPGPSNGPVRKRRGPKVHRKDSQALASIGIEAPFTKSTRRERREFTEQEDAALLRGFEKHGPHWHVIRNDPDLELTHRHPTDLRDRLRNRWPEKYAEAGYKIKLKEKNNKQENQDDAGAGPSAPESSEDKEPSKRMFLQDDNAMLTANVAPHVNPIGMTRKKAPGLKSLLTNYPFPDPFTEDDDFTSDLPFEGECSPVILSRDIFSYAQGQPNAFDLSVNSHADHSHINPLDTLKIPKTSSTTQQPHSSTSLPPLWLPAPLTAGLSSNLGSNMLLASSSAPSSRCIATAASTSTAGGGNSGTVSLPGPADLLMGLDLEGKNDGHSSNFIWEDTTPSRQLFDGRLNEEEA
ncbi:myb dna-binding domain containing protein [Diplodia corticola]|uniref:Myb dna-binding domain containing protein n=1 Tax=Diplodia corticola TaxID=236234 RepID=A0A1J9RA58_9PEZI|nr:myb dna-binding domain containing protein [Diplodia corticola]OJD37353.1 myb dna-binding domain containing protein [Diplodia corticola]